MIKQFNCPKCGKHRLEEIMENVTVTTVITSISVEPDGNAELVYGEQDSNEGDVQCYQCADCGFNLESRANRELITDCEDLNDWILCHQSEDVPEKSEQKE